ncbi:MAG: oligosaccharide flippase family protein [Ignavibacteria bacterium]
MSIIPADFKKIFRNFFSLNLVQLSNIIFPLVTLPYVVRVIGVEKFGLVSFVQSFTMYFVIISDYGFNLSGTREISVNRNDAGRLSEIFSAVLLVKIFIGILCVSVVSILVCTFDIFKANWTLYMISTGIIFGSILFPQWLFQGMEKMELIPAVNIPVKIVQLLLIFLIVKQEEDYILYLFLLSAAQLVIGIFGLITAVQIAKVKPVFPSIDKMKQQLKNGFKYFPVNIGINIFNNSSVFIVGLLAGQYAAGIFSAADKIRLSLQGTLSGFTMSVYPQAVKKINESKQKFLEFIGKIFKVSIASGTLIGLVLFFFPKEIILLLLGPEFKESIIILKLFSIVIIIFSITEVWCYLVLVPFGFYVLINQIILFTTIFHIGLLAVLLTFFNYPWAVYSIIITQLIILAAAWFSIKKKKLMIT